MKKILLMALLGMAYAIPGQAQGEIFMLNDLKINASLGERERIRQFYTEVLEASIITPEDQPKNFSRDYVQFTNDQRLNIIYFDNLDQVATEEELEKGVWLKIRVSDFEGKVARLKASGVEIVNDKSEKGEFYFKAPGGLVFRMVNHSGI